MSQQDTEKVIEELETKVADLEDTIDGLKSNFEKQITVFESLQERIDLVEESPLRRINNPITEKIIYESVYKRWPIFLLPLETADTNEGTHTFLQFTGCIQFADAATGEAYFAFVPPRGLEIFSMEFIWSTPATSGNLYWDVTIAEGGDSEQVQARFTGQTQVATAADGTANDLNFTDILRSGVTANVHLLRRSTLWGIQFTRDGANALDTLSNTVNLYGIVINRLI